MSNKIKNMEMGNLICTFGKNIALLDMFDEVVAPSFFSTDLIRTYGRTKYFFHNVSMVHLGTLSGNTPLIGIAGRMIMDTTLNREQIYKEKEGLVPSTMSIQSSPSSVFLLILNFHRLVFMKETSHAPSKDTFRATLLHFLKRKRKEYIDEQYRNQNSDVRVTKKKLQENIPKPNLELIPLTSSQGIQSFIRRYDVLKSVEISFSERNDENDSDPFFEDFQNRQDLIGSSKSTIKHSNSKGLDKKVTIGEISEATEQGNQKVILSGKDKEGDTLRGNNDNFQLSKPVKNISFDVKKAAGQLYKSFSGLVQSGLVKLPNMQHSQQKFQDIYNRFKDE